LNPGVPLRSAPGYVLVALAGRLPTSIGMNLNIQV